MQILAFFTKVNAYKGLIIFFQRNVVLNCGKLSNLVELKYKNFLSVSVYFKDLAQSGWMFIGIFFSIFIKGDSVPVTKYKIKYLDLNSKDLNDLT